ncbi:MAG: oligosaccharyl transferase, archaeosortase A system-associated [Candidatus Methanoperedens sp.]|nr:oligosaccharyl transferase, archaeosortase A system-associated [Candidatus Methanoperedens sp.]MCZ7370449.1 oligosaccharyl transferase, archaeosortase A system-associated [Candidatus Methanoperedens sp.]
MAKAKPNKKYKEKTLEKRNETKIIESGRFTAKHLSYVILFGIFLFSFYIRGITPIKTVFQRGIVGFAADDSVFHMRLVENTIQFFPHRIFYDAFTYYPNGFHLHWGPLFDQMIAFLAIMAGLIMHGGMPPQSTIDTVGAFFPAVLGALTVFPVYFIGKELLDEKAGLLGAFLIAILPGQWLSRSVLGFTDNHVAEVFYLSLMMMFFVFAIKKSENITFDHWLKKDWAALKTPILYSLLAGISFGAYLLNWSNGVFFAVVFGIFVIVQYIIDHFKGRSTEYLGIVGIIAYLVAMIMVLPYVELSNGFDSGHYSLLHLTVTGGGALIFGFLSLVSREMNKREYSGLNYLVFVIGLILILIIFTKIFLPNLYGSTIGSLNFIFQGRAGGGLTIAEASPLTPEMAQGNFGYNYYLSYFAILALCYYIFRNSRAEHTLLAVWSIFVLSIMLAQNRFAYYYAVNVAILLGFIGSKVLDFGDWKNFGTNDVIEGLKKIRIQHILSLFIIIAVIGFLPLGSSPYEVTMQTSQWGAVSSGYYEWYDALNWMRYNTPAPDLPYNSIYTRPPDSQLYNYSSNDYGVMSWWDYGHIITYWAHRIPNANPFQAGIGGGSAHNPGASTFLIAPTEEKANEVLDKLGINGEPGARYVVSNAYMAYAILTVFAEWDNTDQDYYIPVQSSQGTIYAPSMKYFNTMEAKLHIFDTNGLSHYRLVHESTPNPYSSGGNQEAQYKNMYNLLYKGNIPVENSGYAKIFEYVKGAIITGRAPPDTTITLTNTIKTNIGRTIQYSQTTSSNGTYAFTVPYSTKDMISGSFECTGCFFPGDKGDTQFDTQPTGPYTLTTGNVSKQIGVSELDVLEGHTLTLDLG